ncbi:C40 family peptidase [Psychroflexus sediminis]|uniref:SH3 domain-containing protein n=1 Tax=Psychroflexus sediminis TaxID=470826 RepID=A0A1G7WU09_9FLAO|nr:C40 family peptidase [Psychroflexus sediminis]SDG75421.1 SH3 domain-containing protein [Psychroflexus sediminis]
MLYGICPLSVVPVRAEANDTSEMVTQLLYGDHFEVIETQSKWIKIRIAFDGYEGWLDKKQAFEIDANKFKILNDEHTYSTDLLSLMTTTTSQLMPVCIGSSLQATSFLDHQFDGATNQGFSKHDLVETAMLYLNSPYLWGGKSPFGIDCSGFAQMVYKISGIPLFRDASEQAKQGQALSFIEESEPGDLAFFDNEDGKIIHVGIMMKDNYIIHAHGHVRIDRIDHSGIFNVDTGRYSHNLRVIKTIV